MKINPFKKVRLANHILSKSTKRQTKPKTGSTLKLKEITPDLKTLGFARKVRKKGKNLDSLLKSNIQMKSLAKDMVKNTLLTAIKEKNKSLLKELLLYLRGYPTLKNALLSYQNKQGNTLLHLAVSTEDDDIVLAILPLIKRKIFFLRKNQDQDTPLNLAVDLQDFRIAEKLIIHGPKACYSQNKNGNTTLHLAVQHEDIDLAQKLLHTKPDSCLVENKKGNTPLNLAMT